MLKRIIILIAILTTSSLSFAKFPVNDVGEIEYSEVVQVENNSKDQIYNKIREWFSLNFVNSNAAIKMDDKESGKIIAKSNFPLQGVESFGWINFFVTVEAREGRYRYTISQVRHMLPINSTIKTPEILTIEKPGGGFFTMGQNRWNKIKAEAEYELKMLDIRLKSIFSEEQQENKKDDW